MKYRWILLALFCIPTFLHADSGIEIKSAGGVSEGTDVGFANITATSIQVGAGSAANPSIALGDGDSGLTLIGDNQLDLVIGGVAQWRVESGGFSFAQLSNGPGLRAEGAALSNPTILPAREDFDTGLGWANNVLTLIAGGIEGGRFDNYSTAGGTNFLLYDVDNATLERVTVGVADSGGAGFKVLRIPN